MTFEIQSSEIEKIIFQKESDKYDRKWWDWQLKSNGFTEDEQYRYIHEDLPHVTINTRGGEISICCWHNKPYGVSLFSSTMRNSKKAIEYIQNELMFDNYKKWLGGLNDYLCNGDVK